MGDKCFQQLQNTAPVWQTLLHFTIGQTNLKMGQDEHSFATQHIAHLFSESSPIVSWLYLIYGLSKRQELFTSTVLNKLL